jgi:hypothetical protein
MSHAAWTLPLLSPLGTDNPAASLLAAIEELVPTLRQGARVTERLARVPEANIESLRRVGFFELMRPYAPAVLAETVPDRWSLTGRFGWASGCDNAGWAFCGGVLRPGHGVKTPTAARLLVPMHECRMILDDWDVVGLAGTGSKPLVLDNVTVPKAPCGADALGLLTAFTREHARQVQAGQG